MKLSGWKVRRKGKDRLPHPPYKGPVKKTFSLNKLISSFSKDFLRRALKDLKKIWLHKQRMPLDQERTPLNKYRKKQDHHSSLPWHPHFTQWRHLFVQRSGNSILYSRCVYGKASHMRDFPHCVKCMLECHIFGVRKIWWRRIDERISLTVSAYSRQ